MNICVRARPFNLTSRVTQKPEQVLLRTRFHRMSILKTIGSTVVSSLLDKPPYKDVTSSNKGYEERFYEPSKWVSTQVMSMEHSHATGTAFWKLFSYIQGQNEEGVKIDMTAPVTTKVVPGAGPNCESTFTVSFYIPPKHQDNPPKPTNPDVFIEERPALNVFVQKFGGFANDESWVNHARILTEKVEGKEKFNTSYWYTAGYNSPFQLFGRTNEVWFVKD